MNFTGVELPCLPETKPAATVLQPVAARKEDFMPTNEVMPMENEIDLAMQEVTADDRDGEGIAEFQFCTCVFGFSIPDFESHDVLPTRPKLLQAFRTLLEKAEEDLRHLPNVTVWIQQKGELGGSIGCENDEAVVLFPLNLDRSAQGLVNYCVAHEFAHVLTADAAIEAMECERGSTTPDCQCSGCRNEKNSWGNYLLSPSEQLADALVEKWGYTVPPAKARARERALRKEGLQKLTLEDYPLQCAALLADMA